MVGKQCKHTVNRELNHACTISPSRLNKATMLFCILFSILFSLRLSAQQDPMFSQYMFNKVIVNPAYAGTSNMLNATLAYRQQFIGLEGAPKIQAIAIDAPLKNKPMGFGIKAIHESIMTTSLTEVSAIYAYHLILDKGKLSLGVEGGIFSQATDFSNLRKTTQDDNAIPLGKESILVPDASFGLYYSSKKLYLGGSIKHLLQNELNFSSYTGQDRTLIAKLSSHSYVLGGYRFEPKENIRIEPSLLLKYVTGAPMQMDINLNATFNKMFTIGGTYRTKNAIVFLFQYSFKERLKFGYAYDYIISGLSSYGHSSHGIMLSYHIPSEKKAPDLEEEEEYPEIVVASDSLPEDSVTEKDNIGEPELTSKEEPEPTPTEEPEPIPAEEPEATPTEEPEPTPTEEPVPTPTEEPEPTPTEEPEPTATEELVPTPAEEPEPAPTEESESTPTEEPEPTPTEEPESTPTEESEPTPTEEPEPIPVKGQEKDLLSVGPSGQKEISFKIQILAKKEPIFSTPVNFKGMENIEEYKEEGLFKYVVGLAYDYDYAKSVLLNEVRMQGFADAFIVAFHKGKRIPVKEAIELVKKGSK